MRAKRKPLYDADKDIDTNELPDRTSGSGRPNINQTEAYRQSPPPLPQLIFDGQAPRRPDSTLVGSMDEETMGMLLNGNETMPTEDKGAQSLSVTDNDNRTDFNSNQEFNRVVRRSKSRDSAHLTRSETYATDQKIENNSHFYSTHRRSHPGYSLDATTKQERQRQHKPARASSSCSARGNQPDASSDVIEFIGSLRKERSKLLQEIELEDEEKSAFYTQLEALNQRLRVLPQHYNVGCERWRVEGEMCRLQEVMAERLGSPSVMLRRRDQRLHAINAIEKTIQRLRQDNSLSTSLCTMSMHKDTTTPPDQGEASQVTMDFLNANQVEMVYGLLSMFSSGDKDSMSRTLLAMSSSPDSCLAMRQSGCLPLLIQLLHGGDDCPPTREARLRASQTLHNIVHSHPDDKRGRREARVLRLLEQIRDYSDYLYEKLERTSAGRGPLLEDDMEKHPCPAMAALMKLSFDEDHRHAMCTLGGLHAIAELITRGHEAHGSTTADQYCTTLRRYAGMALTNLTFGDGTNKALLCSFRCFMTALVSQLHSPSEDLRQVTASVLRNLSWRADSGSKISLREVGAVKALMQAALIANKESTLKVILSAVWNLSAHCSMNKADICNVDEALAFVCSTLTYKSQSKTLSIIENGGGILRNISSHIAVRDDLRQVLRDNNAVNILLTQLRSPSLTVVSNACGTLWNLSARCAQDQRSLWELGAVPMLRSLINSKHKMISMGSSAALKNLLQAKPEGMHLLEQRNGGLPTLQARKQKALEQELDPTLSETCDNIESSPRASPTSQLDFMPSVPLYHSLGPINDSYMSESRETIASTHSDKSHDRMPRGLTKCSESSEDKTEDASRKSNNRLHSKVSLLGNKYCNGGGKKRDKASRKVSNGSNSSAEVDEDQPTDFGFRYAEERGHDAQCDNEDTIQSFYTEGTPYETPHIVSSAASLTDLRDTKASSSADSRKHKISKPPLGTKEMDHIEIEDLEDISEEVIAKPTTYCVEGTPVSISRYSSVSSLSSAEINDHIDNELLDDDEETEQLEEPDMKQVCKATSNKRALEAPSTNPSEGRGNACDETPLMFSRTTSLGSLSSFGVNSIHDDRSSVHSDCSRMNSGAVSPSDLPDSPSQTVPTSPKHNRASHMSKLPTNPVSRHSAGGFFREGTRPFMEEGTPVEFSRGTSLSSLTFDSEDFQLPTRSRGDGKDSSIATTASETSHRQSSVSRPESRCSAIDGATHHSRNAQPRPLEAGPNCRSVSLGRDHNDDKKLAALIQSGMPTARRPPTAAPRSKLSPSLQTMPHPPPPKMSTSIDNRPSAIPIKSANLTVTVESINLGPPPVHQSGNNGYGDTLMAFCTEDTPANISQAGSISDLSQLSFPTDAGSRGSRTLKSPNPLPQPDGIEDPEKKKLLERCIQSGMPKPRPSPRGVDARSREKASLPRNPASKVAMFGAARPTPQRVVPVARVKPAMKSPLVSPQEPKRTPTLHSPIENGSKRIAARQSRTPPPSSIPTSRSQPKSLYKEDQLETPVSYMVENTPAQLSRHSSLSSIGMDSEDKSSTPSIPKPDCVRKFGVENTPACFSRNSSLSSLSVASYEDETTPREQALLQKCISQGMPKTKSDLGETTRKPVSRIPSLRSPARIVPGVPMQQLSIRQSHGAPTGSSDSESESRKLRSDASESEKIEPCTVRGQAECSPGVSPPGAHLPTNKHMHKSRFMATASPIPTDMSDSAVFAEEALQLARAMSNPLHDRKW